MTQDDVNALSDNELSQVAVWIQEEQEIRAKQKKRETVAKIKALANSVGVSIKITGVPKSRGKDSG